ncbi:MAG: hypothetical protein FWF51_12515 [Chitinivibrionia bacterium]|nr:hypothetical protein [Chitinivibrionia bacterium]
MKNLCRLAFLLILCFSFLCNVNAEIELLHTFEGGWTDVYTSLDEVEKSNTDFKGFVVGNKIYNEDFSLRKSFDINGGGGSYFVKLLYVSEKIFNNDSKLEFLVVGTQSITGTSSVCQLYDEDGNLLKDFGNIESTIGNMGVISAFDIHRLVSLYLTLSGEYILAVRENLTTTKIYSLPGRKNNEIISGFENIISTLNTKVSDLQKDTADLNDEIEKLLKQLEDCGKSPITERTSSTDLYGIKFADNIVSDKAEISVILPNNERFIETKITIYDVIGNVVYSGNNLIWDLRNNAGRFVANGSYLVIAEVKGTNGKVYYYSAKFGVKR